MQNYNNPVRRKTKKKYPRFFIGLSIVIFSQLLLLSNLIVIATAPAGRYFRECGWSNFGDKIVVLMPYDSEIYTMDADGSNMTLVVDSLPGTVSAPTWAIDGNSILYTHDISGFESPDGRQLDSRIFLKSLIDITLIDLSLTKTQAQTMDLIQRIFRLWT